MASTTASNLPTSGTAGASSTASTSKKASSSSTSTKPVHPLILSSFAPTGCELSTWAYLTVPQPQAAVGSNASSSSKQSSTPSTNPLTSGNSVLPNLVTAHANTLRIYVVDPSSGTLLLASTYENLAGTIVSLHALPRAAGRTVTRKDTKTGNVTAEEEVFDGLLLGFAGRPRLSIVYPPCSGIDSSSHNNTNSHDASSWSGVLTASSIIDLSSPLAELCLGSVTPMEQDLVCSVTEDMKVPAVAVILGGGVGVALFQLPRSSTGAGKTSWWRTASEPYILPLGNLVLPASKPTASATSALSIASTSKYNKYNNPSSSSTTTSSLLCHGFGDIISTAFLSGYTEPVLVLLHSNPQRHGGRAWSGRLAHKSSSTRCPLSLTAVSVSIVQQRSVVLWSLRDAIPADAFEAYPYPSGGVLVLGANEVVYVDCSGRVGCALGVNGWVRSTGSANLMPKLGGGGVSSENRGALMQPNPSPLAKLSIQLDGSCLVFVTENVALISLRDGTLYSLELHNGAPKTKKNAITSAVSKGSKSCMSLSPLGFKLGAVGNVSTICALPLLKIPSLKSLQFVDEKMMNSLSMKKEEDNEVTISEKLVKDIDAPPTSIGLVFAGSRMGDSSLLLYGLQEKTKLVPLEDKKDSETPTTGTKRKRNDESDKDENKRSNVKDEEMKENNRYKESLMSEEDILRMEEEALYAPVIKGENATSVNVIPPSDDEDENKDEHPLMPGVPAQLLARPQIQNLSIFQHIKAIDCLTGLGPIGQGCVGPTASELPSSVEEDEVLIPGMATASANGGSTTNIHSCGFGSSGGLAILTTPGLDYGSTIMSEVDCRNISTIFSCTQLGYVFLTKEEENSGCILLKLEESQVKNEDPSEPMDERELTELDLDSVLGNEEMEVDIPSFANAKDVLTRMNILAVQEFSCGQNGSTADHMMTFVRYGSAYALVILLQSDEGTISVAHTHIIGTYDDGDSLERDGLISVSFIESLDATRVSPLCDILSLSCVWSSGHGSVFTMTRSDKDGFVIKEMILEGPSENDQELPENKVDDDTPPFYCSSKIVAMDIFEIADDIFQPTESCDHEDANPDTRSSSGTNIEPKDEFDMDDLELYGDVPMDGIQVPTSGDEISQEESKGVDMPPSRFNSLAGYVSGAGLSDTSKTLLAVCRQNGKLQIFDVEMLKKGNDEMVTNVPQSSDTVAASLLWSAMGGCGSGASILSTSKSLPRKPKAHNICATEIRLYFSGPSNSSHSNENPDENNISILRSLCLLVATNEGDLHLYSGSKTPLSKESVVFRRVPHSMSTRPSKEEGLHRNKLRRKGIISTNTVDTTFRHKVLHRFMSISGEDGLFAATSRPLWFLSERGAPVVLCHRLRHAAPSGAHALPIQGFCSGLMLKSGDDSSLGFLTLHDRIGRVGSQRLTLFNGLSDIYSPHGILPGGGVCVQKVPLGVTVRHIQFIEDATISTPSHPIYALLVSRETETDQMHLNDDGLTPEERKAIKDEKEKEKTRRQVEADLGGFEIEQEWVEEIEREDCFEVEKRYGGAPPIPDRAYEIWLVDAAGWNVVDKYKLEDQEHGLSMNAMYLSDIYVDPSGNKEETNLPPEKSLFLTVGTGIVDKDGEDVSSRGRILVFELKQGKDGGKAAEINFVYDKNILLGPVTCLLSLSCENMNRLVVGAGAEITVEQWGSGKLTQVGFFHANMQVQDIVLFKTFFLVSDAYDSLHFLVWRESDKSLTLLAKDYEPTAVYSAGLLSRGGAVSFVCHDDRQNLSFFSYAPRDAAARGGNKLVCRADCHLGTQTVSLQSHFCRSSILVNSATIQSTLVALKQQDNFYGKLDDDQRFALHYGSTDGGFGSIMPLNDNIYWRLAALQSVMSNALESDCSLSQRAWRLYRRTPRRGGCKGNVRKKGVIDGDLVMKYIDLPLTEQEELASAIGSTVDLIVDNLLEVSCSSMVV